jgi:hypothetical protein
VRSDLDDIFAGRYRVRYRCRPERESLRQEVYRWARRRGVRVSVLTDGGGRGLLRAVVVIAGQCLERRAEARPKLLEDGGYHSAFKDGAYRAASSRDELADRIAVAQLHSIVRGELRAAGLTRRSA